MITAFALYTSKKLLNFCAENRRFSVPSLQLEKYVYQGLNSLFKIFNRLQNFCSRHYNLVEIMYWSVLTRLITRYSPVVILPFSALIGFIGYKVEGLISDRYTPSVESVKEKRQERLLLENKEAESIIEHPFVPKTIFEKNVPASLKEPDPRLKKYKNFSAET